MNILSTTIKNRLQNAYSDSLTAGIFTDGAKLKKNSAEMSGSKKNVVKIATGKRNTKIDEQIMCTTAAVHRTTVHP